MSKNELTAFDAARNSVQKQKAELMKVLPKHVTFDRFERVVATALRRQPALLRCNPNSLMEAVTLCATDGLVPDGREAALVVFKDRVTYMPMVAGVIKRIQQSGRLASLTSNVVYEGEIFEHWVGERGEVFKHVPDLMIDTAKARVIGAYCVAVTKDQGSYIEVMRYSEIEKVRSASRSGGAGPWKDWWEEMAKKTAIRRLSKKMPMSIEDRELEMLDRDNQYYDFDGEVVEQAPAAAPKARAPKAKASLDLLKAAPNPEPVIEAELVEDDVLEEEY